ncbi:hypothetical protein [Moorena producens]|uniref:hypothetical protein n=1 Tax=Moorena producens TaxID=1155739 RepID=UPI001314C3AF|nr:hypothetical protein [Moorena producens]
MAYGHATRMATLREQLMRYRWCYLKCYQVIGYAHATRTAIQEFNELVELDR